MSCIACDLTKEQIIFAGLIFANISQCNGKSPQNPTVLTKYFERVSGSCGVVSYPACKNSFMEIRYKMHNSQLVSKCREDATLIRFTMKDHSISNCLVRNNNVFLILKVVQMPKSKHPLCSIIEITCYSSDIHCIDLCRYESSTGWVDVTLNTISCIRWN